MYTEKGAITGTWPVLPTVELRKECTGFQVATTEVADARFNPFWRWRLFANSQKILLSRWLHPKLIFTLKFLSNWKTLFLVIWPEQDIIKTLEFTETNSYFYSFTYKETNLAVHLTNGQIFLWISWQTTVDSTSKYSLLAGDTNQTSISSPCIDTNE